LLSGFFSVTSFFSDWGEDCGIGRRALIQAIKQ
jgi:hypothetical protein